VIAESLELALALETALLSLEWEVFEKILARDIYRFPPRLWRLSDGVRRGSLHPLLGELERQVLL